MNGTHEKLFIDFFPTPFIFALSKQVSTWSKGHARNTHVYLCPQMYTAPSLFPLFRAYCVPFVMVFDGWGMLSARKVSEIPRR